MPILEDSYSESNRNSDTFLHDAFTKYAQSFTASASVGLLSCKFYLDRTAGAIGTLTAGLYTLTGSFGSTGKPTGSALATSTNSIDISTLSSSTQSLQTFNFDGTYQLVAGTNYCISIESSGMNPGDMVYIGYHSNPVSGYTGNRSYYNGSWGSLSGDLCFYVYGVSPNVEASLALAINKQLLAASVTSTIPQFSASLVTSINKQSLVIVDTSTTPQVTSANRYWVGGTGTWNDNTHHWSATSGGAPGASLPLYTDNVFFDNNSASGSYTVSQAGLQYCNNFTANAPVGGTLTITTGLFLYGNIYLGPNVIYNTGLICKATSGTQTIDTANATLGANFSLSLICTAGVIVKLLSNLISSNFISSNLTVVRGNFDANGYNITLGMFYIDGTPASTIKMGSGTWNMYAWLFMATGNASIDGGSSNLIISEVPQVGGQIGTSGAFFGGNQTYNNIWFYGPSITTTPINIGGSNTFNEFKVDAGRTITFDNGSTTTVSSFFAVGTDGNVITLKNYSASTDYNLVLSGSGSVTCDYVLIDFSNASPGGAWFAGQHSNNTGHNIGWIFSSPATYGIRNKKAIMISGDSFLAHDNACRVAFINMAPADWQCDLIVVGDYTAGPSLGITNSYGVTEYLAQDYSHVVARVEGSGPGEGIDPITYVITHGYDIVIQSKSAAWSSVSWWDSLTDAGVLCVVAHNDDTSQESSNPPYLFSPITCGEGHLHNQESWGPGLELFTDEGAILYGESLSTPTIAGQIANIFNLHPTYNLFDARQHLRQTCTFYPTWTEQDGYGHIQNEDFSTLDLAPPLAIQAILATDCKSVIFVWRNFLQTRFHQIRIVKESTGEIIYRGIGQATLQYPVCFDWVSNVSGTETFIFRTEDLNGNLSPVPTNASIQVLGLIQAIAPPNIDTEDSPNGVTSTFATLNGYLPTVIDIIENGFYWGLSGGALNTKITVPLVAKGTFSYFLEGLSPDTTYYYKAYATNSTGTVYSVVKSFTTLVTAINPSFVGTAAKDGVVIQGAVVCLLDTINKKFVGKTTSNDHGRFCFTDLDINTLYHVVIEYTDSNNKLWNSKSFPFLTPGLM